MTEERCAFCRTFGLPKFETNVIIITGAVTDTLVMCIEQILDDNIDMDLELPELRYTKFERFIADTSDAFAMSDNMKLSDASRRQRKRTCCLSSTILRVNIGNFKKQRNNFFKWFCSQSISTEDSTNQKSNQGSLDSKWYLLIAPYFSDSEFWKIFIDMKRIKETSADFIVINFVVTGTRLFENAIDDRREVSDYNKNIIPSYETSIKDLIREMDSCECFQKRTILIEDHRNFIKEHGLETLFKSLYSDAMNSYYLKNTNIRDEIIDKFKPERREPSDIYELRKTLRAPCKKLFEPMMVDLVSRLKNTKYCHEAARDVIELLYGKYQRYNREERAYLKRILTIGFATSDVRNKNTVLMQLILVAKQLLKVEDERLLPLSYGVFNVLWKMSRYNHYAHRIHDESTELFLLSLSYVDHMHPTISSSGLALCAIILAFDGFDMKYARKFLEVDPMTCKKIIHAVIRLLSPFLVFQSIYDREPKNDSNSSDDASAKNQQVKILAQYTNNFLPRDPIKPLASLFRIFIEDCGTVTKEDMMKLVNIISVMTSEPFLEYSSIDSTSLKLAGDLCCLLLPVIQYGNKEVNSLFEHDVILPKSIATIIDNMDKGDFVKDRLECCLELFNYLVRLQFASSVEKESASENGDENISSQGNLMADASSSNTEVRFPKTLSIEDILDRHYKLHGEFCGLINSNQMSLKNEEVRALFHGEWKKLDFVQMKYDLEQKKQDHKKISEQVEQAQEKLKRLQIELERVQQSKNEMSEQLCQSLLKSNGSHQKLTSIQGTGIGTLQSDEGDPTVISELDELSPENINTEQAKRFINEINKRRIGFTDPDMRNLISGSLKHLGSDLYSSPVHFLHELIQNAEDNMYMKDIEPRLRITINHEYILFSNNERGLRAQDVLSICSLAVSTKTGEQYHLGEKGVGFKSVFAVTNQPTIISHAWKFRFEVPGVDRLAYITPIWINDEIFLEPIADHLSSCPDETHIYLPLKLSTESEAAKQLLDELFIACDPCILLNMQKLQQLHIHDKRTGKTINIQKKVQSKIDLKNTENVDFECYKFLGVSGSIVELDGLSNSQIFRVYQCHVEIPSALEQQRQLKTSLRLIFPCDQVYKPNATVYVGLPVCDLGFQFMFNADFQLVTNRENVRENVPFNCDLRDYLAAFFIYLMMNDNDLKKDWHRYYPSQKITQEIHSPWWKILVDVMNKLVINNLSNILDSRQGIYMLRYWNSDVQSLVSKSELCDFANIDVIEVNEFFNKERLDTYGVKPVTMIDVLNCFPSQNNPNNEQFYCQAINKDETWWSSLFHHLFNEMSSELSKIMFSKPIFLLNKNQRRTYLPSDSHILKLLYISEDQSIEMWKKKLTLILCKSDFEANALLSSNQVQLLTEDELIEIILLDHLQKANSLDVCELDEQQSEEIWGDLYYLRSRVEKFDCTRPLIIPVENSIRPRLISETIVPTVFGLDVKEFVCDRTYPFVKLPLKNTNDDELYDLLLWEYFLLKVHCRAPLLELKGNHSIETLPIINIFEKLQDKQYADVTEFILSKQSSRTIETLQSFPVIAYVSGVKKKIPIGKTYHIAGERHMKFLPQIDVEHPFRRLANQLGVYIDYNVHTYINILSKLAKNGVEDIDTYVEYLSRLQIELRNPFHQVDFGKLQKSCYIYLKDDKAFCRLDKLFILNEHDDDDLQAIEQICKYLGWKIISRKHNEIYGQFKSLFNDLKLKCSLTPIDVSLAIHRANEDTRNFHTIGNGKFILNINGKELMIILFKYLEYKILENIKTTPIDSPLHQMVIQKKNQAASVGSSVDLRWRFDLLMNKQLKARGSEIKQSLTRILSDDNKMIKVGSSNVIYACFQTILIENLRKAEGRRYFVSPVIVRECPLVLAVLEIDYVERIGSFRWFHRNMNLMWMHHEWTRVFQEHAEDKEIIFLSAAFVEVQLSVTRDLDCHNRIDDVHQISIMINDHFLILGKLVIICSLVEDEKNRRNRAILALATLLHHKKNIDFEEALCRARHASNSFSFSDNGEGWDSEETKNAYKLVEVIFPIDYQTDEPMATIAYRNYTPRSRTDENDFLIVSSKRSDIDEKYRLRVQHDKHELIHPRQNPQATELFFMVQSENNTIVAQNAEHYFFDYLQYRYGNDKIYPMKNWKSSNRLAVYPRQSCYVKDSVGYDFVIKDTLELFAKRESNHVMTCYFEVQGTSGSFYRDHTWFCITENERAFCSCIATDAERRKSEAYILVIIEKCLDADSIKIADVINWSKNIGIVKLDTYSYFCKIALGNRENEVNVRQQESYSRGFLRGNQRGRGSRRGN